VRVGLVVDDGPVEIRLVPLPLQLVVVLRVPASAAGDEGDGVVRFFAIVGLELRDHVLAVAAADAEEADVPDAGEVGQSGGAVEEARGGDVEHAASGGGGPLIRHEVVAGVERQEEDVRGVGLGGPLELVEEEVLVAGGDDGELAADDVVPGERGEPGDARRRAVER